MDVLGAPPNEVDDSSPRSSYMETPRGGKSGAAGFSGGAFGLSLVGQDEATRIRRRRRREANYLFASMDISKHSKVSLNEFLAATLDSSAFFKDEKLLADAFARITGDTNDGIKGAITSSTLQPMMGKRFTDRKAKRLIGEFVAIARFNPADVKLIKKKSVGNILSKKSHADLDDDDADFGANTGGDVSPRRVDVDRLEFGDFVKGLQREN